MPTPLYSSAPTYQPGSGAVWLDRREYEQLARMSNIKSQDTRTLLVTPGPDGPTLLAKHQFNQSIISVTHDEIAGTWTFAMDAIFGLTKFLSTAHYDNRDGTSGRTVTVPDTVASPFYLFFTVTDYYYESRGLGGRLCSGAVGSSRRLSFSIVYDISQLIALGPTIRVAICTPDATATNGVIIEAMDPYSFLFSLAYGVAKIPFFFTHDYATGATTINTGRAVWLQSAGISGVFWPRIYDYTPYPGNDTRYTFGPTATTDYRYLLLNSDTGEYTTGAQPNVSGLVPVARYMMTAEGFMVRFESVYRADAISNVTQTINIGRAGGGTYELEIKNGKIVSIT